MTTNVKPERRKAARREISLNGTLNCSRGSQVPIAIVDLSAEGFSADMGQRAMLGGRGFSVKVAGLESLGAELRWSAAASAGFRFAQPLHPAVLDHVVRAHPAESETD